MSDRPEYESQLYKISKWGSRAVLIFLSPVLAVVLVAVTTVFIESPRLLIRFLMRLVDRLLWRWSKRWRSQTFDDRKPAPKG